ncbi:MAG TPA: GIDE domain-containing protein [Terriglobia bacterium]|nr:GIDE domain-containing protein [Terriglobia bacterium]
MPACESVTAGGLLLGVGLLLLLRSSHESHQARLLAKLPVSPCGRVREGLVLASGRAVSSASLSSLVLGLPCIISECTLEAYWGPGRKEGWKAVARSREAVPFYIEDATGRTWVDPADAEWWLLPDVEYSAGKRWKPTAGHLVKFGGTELTAELLEQRARQCCERQNADAGKRRLRFRERNVMAGDTVTVLGPAYAAPAGHTGAAEVRIHRVHPGDPFVIGDGPPAAVAARMRKQAGWIRGAGLGCMALGAALVIHCYV